MIAASEPLAAGAAPSLPTEPTAAVHRHPLREPLVWLVAGIPLLTIVAGMITLWIAFQRADSNVTEDYYKEGLGINRRIERDDQARAYGLAGQFTVAPDAFATADGRRLAIELDLSGEPQAFEPQVRLRMTHPVHQSLDRQVVLHGVGGGRYRGQLLADGLDGTRWTLAIETDAWRVGMPGLSSIAPGTRLQVAHAPAGRPAGSR
jgi:uncharacterized protein